MTEETNITQSLEMGDWFPLFTNCQRVRYTPALDRSSFKTSQRYSINVTAPKNYDKKLISFDTIYNYFVDIIEETYQIEVLDKVNLRQHFFGLVKCDYCRIVNGKYKICTLCNKNMCALCYTERTEEIARRNGAKNWERRKDKLLACFEKRCCLPEIPSPMTDNLIYDNTLCVNCDNCRISSNVRLGIWLCNRRENKDLCPKCIEDIRFMSLMSEEFALNWKPVRKTDPTIIPFGSILDWIPIYVSAADVSESKPEFDSIILYNINIDSENYHKIALGHVNKDNRVGFYILDQLANSLDKLIKDVKEKGVGEILDININY